MPPPTSPFLILEASLGFSRLLSTGKAAASAQGRVPRVLSQLRAVWPPGVGGRGGGCCSRLLLRLRDGLERVGARAR